MKVTQPKPEFKPVTIVLNSKEELAALISIVGLFDGSKVSRSAETFLIRLRANLSKTNR